MLQKHTNVFLHCLFHPPPPDTLTFPFQATSLASNSPDRNSNKSKILSSENITCVPSTSKIPPINPIQSNEMIGTLVSELQGNIICSLYKCAPIFPKRHGLLRMLGNVQGNLIRSPALTILQKMLEYPRRRNRKTAGAC